ncbi:MAG TPA: hypothetical protein VN682_28090 [Terriglobales bacterium]|nr:hypothetical protein [Terriglobales bacterium]
MAEWKTRPSRLLVPAFPQSRLPMSSLPAGWPSPKPRRRIFTHPGVKPAEPAAGSWSIRDLHVHVKGRANATAEILIGVAILKRVGAIWNYFVDITGAVWQDWEGSSELSHRAHRVPCNPIITNCSIPDLAPTISLRNALIDPLARTDFLPIHANYADSRFEKFGGAESLATAVRVVAREQARDRTVDYDLFRHAVLAVAQAGYNAAYEQVGREVQNAMNSETVPEFFSRTDEHNPVAPKNNLESVQDAAYELLRFSKSTMPDLVNRAGFQAEVDRQTRLASGKDVHSVPLR